MLNVITERITEIFSKRCENEKHDYSDSIYAPQSCEIQSVKNQLNINSDLNASIIARIRDLRKEQQVLSRRSMGGGGTMIWGSVCY